MIIDGTLCPIQHPSDKQEEKANTNGKYKKFGYLYLLLVQATDGKIVHYYGHWPEELIFEVK